MRVWADNPSAQLESVIGEIAVTRMAGLPICNPALRVEAVGFRRSDEGHWIGVMIAPWAINLLCLPGEPATWPQLAACSKYDWRFPSGNYEFTVAHEDRLGTYHLCSLFSPAVELTSHEQARLTALAVIEALFAAPIAAPAVYAEAPRNRRAFLGLRG